MRKQIVLGLTLLLALAAAVFAGEKASAKDYHRIHGDIASIDATAQTFTVKHGKDTSTFKTDANTKYIGPSTRRSPSPTSRSVTTCASPSSRTASTRRPPASTSSTGRRRCSPRALPGQIGSEMIRGRSTGPPSLGSPEGESWCRRWESNPHARKGRRILSPLRLPFRHSGRTGWES